MIGGTGGGGCTLGGVVATVRLNNGQIVRAISPQYGIVHDGALVTVEKFRLLCGLARYTILRNGLPATSIQQTRDVHG